MGMASFSFLFVLSNFAFFFRRWSRRGTTAYSWRHWSTVLVPVTVQGLEFADYITSSKLCCFYLNSKLTRSAAAAAAEANIAAAFERAGLPSVSKPAQLIGTCFSMIFFCLFNIAVCIVATGLTFLTEMVLGRVISRAGHCWSCSLNFMRTHAVRKVTSLVQAWCSLRLRHL